MEFQFVNSDISCPTIPKDSAVRSMIRKQAMKKASAARKRDGNYGQHNLRQYPVFFIDEEYSKPEQTVELRDQSTEPEPDCVRELAVVKAQTREWSGHNRNNHTSRVISILAQSDRSSVSLSCPLRDLMESVPATQSAWAYPSKTMPPDFDLLALSTLATLHTGRDVRAAFSQKPMELILQLTSQKRWTYLSFLPSRYEHSRCLRDATDCAIARVRRTIAPDTISEALVINNYLRALRSLQSALNCSKERVLPEVLCATEIMALYEVRTLITLIKSITDTLRAFRSLWRVCLDPSLSRRRKINPGTGSWALQH